MQGAGDLKFVESIESTLEDRLTEQVSALVRKSLEHANRNQDYRPDVLQEFLLYYRPKNVKNIEGTPIVSVFAYVGTKLVGTAFLVYRNDRESNQKTAHLYGMYSDPDYRDFRIGSRLFSMIEKKARKLMVERIEANSMIFEATRGFYKSRGFIEGERNDYPLPSGKIFGSYSIQLTMAHLASK